MGKSSSQLSRSRPELTNNDGDSSIKAKRKRPMTTAENGADQARLPLSEVVSDCTERWFQDSLKEAKSGDVNMQVLVAQMYYCGYGVPQDAEKGKIWMTRASRVRSSVWKVRNKRPGYNASDSDSDESDGDS
ncbi:Sel1 repeat protein [Perilla frutescens var. frutescens]|nr:Sel1 repeat protein [Perilla frutescens var. frutescens]